MRGRFLVVCGLAAVLVGAAESDGGEPVVIATANLNATNPEARAAAEAVSATRADIVVLTECTRTSLAEDTLEANGLRVVLDGRDPSPWGICLASRIEGETALVGAPWKGPCTGPMAVGRFELGGGSVAVLGVHLPPRVPVCEASTDSALTALSALIRGGRLVVDVGPARAGDPVLVVGDLNSSDRKLAPLRSAGIAETGETEGVKLTTWHAGPIRSWLDHVFAPSAWPAEGTRSFRIPGSDHDGVVARVSPG